MSRNEASRNVVMVGTLVEQITRCCIHILHAPTVFLISFLCTNGRLLEQALAAIGGGERASGTMTRSM